MGCRRLTYYQNLPELNTVSSKKELTPKNSAKNLRSKNLYRYNGKEKDEESGLYEYGQRYYAPWVCRFVSVDPVAEDYPHLSSYNYASNRPVTSVDAEGLQTPDEPKGNSGGQSSPPIDSTLEGNPESANPTTENTEIHKVKEKETISGLAQQYGVSQDAIRDANPQTQKRDRKDQINVGENLVIPMDPLPDSNGIEKLNSRDAEGLERIDFDDTYEENLELQPDIANKIHEIEKNNNTIKQLKNNIAGLQNKADSVQRDMDIVNHSTLKKTDYPSIDHGDEVATMVETGRQILREINRDKFKSQAHYAQ